MPPESKAEKQSESAEQNTGSDDMDAQAVADEKAREAEGED